MGLSSNRSRKNSETIVDDMKKKPPPLPLRSQRKQQQLSVKSNEIVVEESKKSSDRRSTRRNSLSRSMIETPDEARKSVTRKLTRQTSLRERKPMSSPQIKSTRGRKKKIQVQESITEKHDDTSQIAKSSPPLKRRVTLCPSEIVTSTNKSNIKTHSAVNLKPTANSKDNVEIANKEENRLASVKAATAAAAATQGEGKEVRVPGYRVTAPIKPGYRLEGTEDTTDDCYLKRHQKHEAEEIRIKRWDMRRQKEEFERNKLLKGRYNSSSKSSSSNSKNKPSSAPPSADPSNSSLASSAHSNKQPVCGPHGIYYRKFDPLQLDEVDSVQVIHFDAKTIPIPVPASIIKPAEEIEQQSTTKTGSNNTNKKPQTGKKNHQNTPSETNTLAIIANRRGPSPPPQLQAAQLQPIQASRKRARLSSTASSLSTHNDVENNSENVGPSLASSKHYNNNNHRRSRACAPLNSVTNNIVVFEANSNHSVYDDLDLDYMSSSTNSLDEMSPPPPSFVMRASTALNHHNKRKPIPNLKRVLSPKLLKMSPPRKRTRLS